MFYPTVGQQSYNPTAQYPTSSIAGPYGAMSFASASSTASTPAASPFNMNVFPFNIPRTATTLPVYRPQTPVYSQQSQPQYFFPQTSYPSTTINPQSIIYAPQSSYSPSYTQQQYQLSSLASLSSLLNGYGSTQGTNISGLSQSLQGISTSLNQILSLLSSRKENETNIITNYFPKTNISQSCINAGRGSGAQGINEQSIINLLMNNLLGGNNVQTANGGNQNIVNLLQDLLGNGNGTTTNNDIDGTGLIDLLQQLLNDNPVNTPVTPVNPTEPELPDLPTLPTPDPTTPTTGPGVWGDPHFTTKFGNFDFQGTEGFKNAKNGANPVYRLYDNGASKINAEFSGNANKSVSVISSLSAKVGSNVVKYDAATKKLTVDGKEIKAGESTQLLHTGIKVDGREVAGSVSVDEKGQIRLDVGDRILNFGTAGSWAGHSYINVTTTNTQVGTQATDAGNGQAFRQGGTLGFVDGVTKAEFTQLVGGGKAAIEKRFDETFHVGSIDDFAGWKGFGTEKTTYQYGVNANETTAAA